MRARGSWLAFALLLVLAGPAAARDVVVLNDGERIEGELVEENDAALKIRIGDGTVYTLFRNDVRSVTRGVPDVASARPGAPRGVEGAPRAAALVPARPLVAAEKKLLDVAKSVASPEAKRLQALKELAAKDEGARAACAAEVKALLAKCRTEYAAALKADRGRLASRLGPLVVERRRDALALINDKRRYPDEDHGAVGQPEVDRLVGRLRALREDPLAEAPGASPRVERLAAEAVRLATWLQEPLGQEGDPEKVKDELRREAAAAVDLASIPVEPGDDKVIARNRAVAKRNEKVKTSLDAEERACLVATNEYRALFGLVALKAHEPLVQAARKHSRAMVEERFFAHDSPLQGLRTPEQRCRREGSTFSGENIAMGMTDGAGAFDCWYRSSGHHRNLVGRDHRSLGVGRQDDRWTQDFGTDDPGE